MRILGIETSCDETSAAVVDETGDLQRPWIARSNVIASQVPIHREWGGVVPELASRQHIRDLCRVVDRAMDEAGTSWSDLGAIAVTQGPGLVGSLLVGVSFAKAAAMAAGLPLVAVHHLAGHIESLVLQNGELPLPAVVLVVSGGHTSLYLVEHAGEYHLISRTRDDAAGEAYDKVAKLLGLGYPGGPVIDRLARSGNDRAVPLPTTRLTHADRNAPALKGDLDFSFSGLKTAVVQLAEGARAGMAGAGASRYAHEGAAAAAESGGMVVPDVAAAFQEAVVDVLATKTVRAARERGVRQVVLAGGVAANAALRARLAAELASLGIALRYPPVAFCTDNAAMIAAAGYFHLHLGERSGYDLDVRPGLQLPFASRA
jgi:tRNA N6-adenosine threonylcarbamoyltransferase